jgi:hypothetical protein
MPASVRIRSLVWLPLTALVLGLFAPARAIAETSPEPWWNAEIRAVLNQPAAPESTPRTHRRHLRPRPRALASARQARLRKSRHASAARRHLVRATATSAQRR